MPGFEKLGSTGIQRMKPQVSCDWGDVQSKFCSNALSSRLCPPGEVCWIITPTNYILYVSQTLVNWSHKSMLIMGHRLVDVANSKHFVRRVFAEEKLRSKCTLELVCTRDTINFGNL